jgi:hypothetical protein
MTAPRRRWSFSLRMLFGVVTVVAIVVRLVTAYPRHAELAIGLGIGVVVASAMPLALFLPWIFRRRP